MLKESSTFCQKVLNTYPKTWVKYRLSFLSQKLVKEPKINGRANCFTIGSFFLFIQVPCLRKLTYGTWILYLFALPKIKRKSKRKTRKFGWPWK